MLLAPVRVFPQIEENAEKLNFLRNVVFSKLTKLLSLTSDGELRELSARGWRGIGHSSDLAWLALEGARQSPQTFTDELKSMLGQRALLSVGPEHVNDLLDRLWLKNLVERQNSQIRADLGEGSTFRVGFADFIQSRFQWKKAEESLSHSWPEMLDLYRRLVSHVVWVESEEFWSSSSQVALGLVYVSPKNDWSLAHFIETIVHETAHIELRLHQWLDPMITNPEQRAPSPLRPDPRPLNGVLHSVFVLSRTTEALRRFAHSVEDEAEREAALGLLRSFQQKFLDGLDTLAQYARWTEKGQDLFEALKKRSTA